MTIPEGVLDSEPDNDEFGCDAEPILQLLIERPDVVGPYAATITPALFPLAEFPGKHIAAAIGVLAHKGDMVARAQLLLLDHLLHSHAERIRANERSVNDRVADLLRRTAK